MIVNVRQDRESSLRRLRKCLHAWRACKSVRVVLLSSSAIFAQDQAPAQGQGQGGGQWSHGPMNPMTADERLQRMTKQLSLTEAQQQQIKPILENEAKQMQTLREDSSLSQDDRRTKMMQIRQESSTQIKPILNADQQKQYEEMMSRQGRGHGQGGADRMQPQGASPQ